MSNAPNPSPQPSVQTEIERLHAQCISAILATTDAGGDAQASYAPYAFLHGCYYILISALAAHTQHILNNPNVGLLIIEDESSARNVYTRARLSYET
ncbi:MAG: pyridoxamine 5'-phosphate oxidase family protein, partial [Hydromonas sp.]|nr:pyridoxamine 5'-phosphate oxidase family protein [Hydromonas sp.]